jgi:hypothetical protein
MVSRKPVVSEVEVFIDSRKSSYNFSTFSSRLSGSQPGTTTLEDLDKNTRFGVLLGDFIGLDGLDGGLNTTDFFFGN